MGRVFGACQMQISDGRSILAPAVCALINIISFFSAASPAYSYVITLNDE